VGDGAVALEGSAEVAPPGLGEREGPFTILAVGTDECGPISAQYLGERCEKGNDGILNDVNILVHVSDDPRRVTVVSFPRDLMVEVPACTREDGSEASAMSKQPLNSVYAHAGLPCVVKTLSQLSGFEIEFAAKLSFDGVIEMTNAIGGVTVCIAEPGLSDTEAGIKWPAGDRTIEGQEALAFLRTRHAVGDGSDLARISNQQQYMSRLARKILSEEVLGDASALLRLANTAAENIVPSESLSNPLMLVQLGLAMRKVPFEDFVFLQYPSAADPDNPSRVVPNSDAAAAIWAALEANQPLEITGGASPVGGVEEIEPAPTTEPTPDASGAAPEVRVTLPPEVTGQTVAQQTCSAANVG
jgi:LCP family protein required for cell wall assembly